ncbi:MAG TPA: Fe-S protein assembly co-chaperone HscB [Kofleriaceae bacterium]|nr:Fe-S protein assembly co-chaperone HscB [Kofleriaceae bacterium]
MERASNSDAFGLLGLPAQFDLDPQVIEKAFHDKSKDLHPDRFASAPAPERVAALSRSRALNDAYKTLKNPVGRAEYLLAQAGVTIGDNERLDPTFLMEILELREELAQARVAKQTSLIEKLCGEMKARRKTTLAKLPALFVANDLHAIKEQLMLLRYVDRYLEECDSALDED